MPQPSGQQNSNLSSFPVEEALTPLGTSFQSQNSNISSLPVAEANQPLGTSFQLDGNLTGLIAQNQVTPLSHSSHLSRPTIQPETSNQPLVQQQDQIIPPSQHNHPAGTVIQIADTERQVSSLVPLPAQTNGPNLHFSTNFPNSPPPGFQFRNFPPPFHPAGIFPQHSSGTSNQPLQTSAPPFHPAGTSTASSGMSANPAVANSQTINTHQPTTAKNVPPKVKNPKMSDDDVKNHPLYKNQISQLEICRGTNVSLSNKISRLEESIRILENKNLYLQDENQRLKGGK